MGEIARDGADNDLKDMLETAVVKAMDLPRSVIYAFGAKWGPEKGKPDKYFKFVPGNGIHDIHMNQGNSGKYKTPKRLARSPPQRSWLADAAASCTTRPSSRVPGPASRSCRRRRGLGASDEARDSKSRAAQVRPTR